MAVVVGFIQGDFMIKISRMLSNTHALSIDFTPESILGSDWSPAIFANNYRNNDNFMSTDLMVLDVDDGPCIAEAKALFKDYKHIIATTRSHQLDKHGLVCDRYRVILFLESTITDKDTFTATWYSLFNQFKFIDQACKDPGRFYYGSMQIIQNQGSGKLISPIQFMKAVEKTPTIRNNMVKGKLAKKTYEFLAEGAPDGQWNPMLFKAAKDMQQNNYSLDEAIEKLGGMRNPFYSGALDKKDMQTIKSAFNKEPKHDARIESSVSSFLQSSTIVMDIEDTEYIIAINNNTHLRQKVDKKILTLVSNNAEDIRQRVHICKFIYNPKKRHLIFEDGGLLYYNTYEPAAWEVDSFFNSGALPTAAELPTLVNRFLMHLVDGNEKSFNYLLDWLHWGLVERNFTVLTLIGNEGVGKGVLTDLAGNMFGRTNYSKARANIFKGRFNSLLADKRLVLLDELELRTSEEYNLFKDLVNEYIVIERKGKDEQLAKNYSSFILASNNRSGIRPPHDDRRFSLIHLTEEKLLSKFSQEEINTIAKSQELANEFAAYLISYTPINDKLIPYKDEIKRSEIENAGRPEWQDYLLHDIAPDLVGKEILLAEIQGMIKNGVGLRGLIGRRKLEDFQKLHDNVFKIIRKGTTRYIKFLGGADGH